MKITYFAKLLVLVFFISLTLLSPEFSHATEAEPFKIEILYPELEWEELKPLNTFTVDVLITNQGYISETNTNLTRIGFEFQCLENTVRIINGNCDSSIWERQQWGGRGELIDIPYNETVSVSYEIKLRDDRWFKLINWYELVYHVTIKSCNITDTDSDPPAIKTIGQLGSLWNSQKVFGSEYVDYIYSLVKDLDPSTILYTHQLGMPLSKILEEGKDAELRDYAYEKGVAYAWSYYRPDIDGLLSENEWDDAFQAEFNGTRFFMKNDEENVYIAIIIDDVFDYSNRLHVRFDYGGLGLQDNWEDALRIVFDELDCFQDLHYHHTGHVEDRALGGTDDGEGAFSTRDGLTYFEMSHPLNSSDNMFDMNLKPGFEFTVGIAYYDYYSDTMLFSWPEEYRGYSQPRMEHAIVARTPNNPDKRASFIEFSVDPEEPMIGELAVISGRLNPRITNSEVTIRIRSNLIDLHVETVNTSLSGEFDLSYVFTDLGSLNIKVEYDGDDMFYGSQSTQPVHVTLERYNNTSRVVIEKGSENGSSNYSYLVFLVILILVLTAGRQKI